MKKIKLSALDLSKTLSTEAYEKSLKSIQHKLSIIQQSYLLQKKKAVIVFEGIDAAGKGGIIRRLSWALDPRGFNVYPTAAPDESEKKCHYLQRFWRHLPREGNFSIFDRSWYGRVLVERVEKFATALEWKRAYKEINEFEKILTNDGVKIIKIFLHISSKEQLKRFKGRLYDPLKRWKLTEEDFRNQANQKAYNLAFEEMLEKTSRPNSPWHIVACDDKNWARIQCLKILEKELTSIVDVTPMKIDPKLQRLANKLKI
jgi:polyphosphate kinase 2 (PPK2 family)